MEIVDRMSSSKQDVYLVRIKSGGGGSGSTPRHLQSHRASLVPSSQSGNSLAASAVASSSSGTGKVLEGYLPGTVLSVMPTHRSAGLPSPSNNPMDADQAPTAGKLVDYDCSGQKFLLCSKLANKLICRGVS